MTRHGLHRITRLRNGPRRKAIAVGVVGGAVVAGIVATMMPLLASDDLSIRAVADTTATIVTQDGDNATKTTLATCPARCDGNPRGGREAVVEFAVTTVPAAAVNVRATLRMHAWQQFAATVTAHASPLSARETRPAPATAGAALDTVTGVAKGVNEWDVSKLVTGNGTWTVSLAQTGLETRVYWGSVENRNPELRPSLVISYDLGTPPSSAPTTRPAPTPSPSVPPTTAAPKPTPTLAPTRTPTPTGSPELPSGRCGQVSDTLVPSCGAWWGMYSPANAGSGWDHAKAITTVEAQVGRKFDIVHRYHDFSNAGSNGAFPDAYEAQQMREGRLMFFAWESRDFSAGTTLKWSDVYSGRHDATIDAVAGRIRAAKVPVFLGFDHEPEDEPNKGSDADFVRAWKYVYERFAKAGADNAVWVWTMMGWSGHYSRYAGLYPGDRYVDWVAYDPYNFHVCNGSTVWKSPSTTVDGFYRWLDENGIGAGKPRMLAEFGTNFNSADKGAKQRWFQEFPAALKAHPKIKAAIYFNSPGMTTRTATCDMTMNHDASAVAGFTQAGKDAYLRQPTGGSR
ncbi:glycosyl hydrolase [Micromonospora lupini]|uniref:Exported glycoside hydrolase n=1 Tax=Micromonospora lupini str. Lupac 08 TaxID=1150864 RepID=I0L176_9ACTN|nr:glycosyl hydrolase [Micromonospora lupini]CCH17573.1 exported glycoside hydrolase [Micromonospora lupini str. Lupac 08]